MSMTLVLSQVNKQMYTSKAGFTNSGPATSAPVLAKVYHYVSLNSDMSDDGLTLYDLPL